MIPGSRVYNTLTNQAGVLLSQPYIADNAMYLVVDVRWDAERLGRSTVAVSRIVLESTLR